MPDTLSKPRITARERAEQRFRLAIEAAQNAMLIADRDGRIVYVNRQTEVLFAYDRSEMLNQPVEMLVPERFRADHPARRREFLRRPTTRSKGAGRDLFGRRKDGAEFPVEIGLNPCPSPEGVQVLASIVDITERKRHDLEAAEHAANLVMVNNALSARNRELDQFTYVASHDLQEPLRKLIAFSKLLRQDLGVDLPEKAGQDLGFIIDASERMHVIVQDLLEFSRSSYSALERVPVRVDDCVNAALENLATRIEETNALIERVALPTVRGDMTLLTQLYQNLIGNALKFVRPGIRPVIRLTSGVDEDGWELGVADNGIGIKPDYAEAIFAPFKRLHGRSEYEGTGIGLAICRKVLERHGGRIWVESEPGRGSHFKFTLQTEKENESWIGKRDSQPRCSS